MSHIDIFFLIFNTDSYILSNENIRKKFPLDRFLYSNFSTKLDFLIINVACIHIVNENAGSLVEQSMNITAESKSVATMKSVESVQTKSVVESSTSIKSVTSSSTRSHQSMEYEETIEYSD